MSKIPVSALYDNCEMMLHDGWGYIWGTAGVICTQAVINKAIERHPSTADITKKYGPKWLGRMVTDCSGVMVYIWHKYGKTIPHGSSSMVSKKYIVGCSAIPHPGYAALIDPTPETDDNNHIGIVSADGKYVYEAKGTQYGFVKTPIEKSKFNKFGKFADVTYEATEDEQQGGETVIWTAIVSTESGRLNVRSGPGTQYPRIGSLPKGEEVDVFAEKDNWAYIAGDGLQGYVSKQYLTPSDPPQNASEELHEEIPTEPDTPVSEPLSVAEWGVYIPCDNEEEARRYAGDIKNAVILRKECV